MAIEDSGTEETSGKPGPRAGNLFGPGAVIPQRAPTDLPPWKRAEQAGGSISSVPGLDRLPPPPQADAQPNIPSHGVAARGRPRGRVQEYVHVPSKVRFRTCQGPMLESTQIDTLADLAGGVHPAPCMLFDSYL